MKNRDSDDYAEVAFVQINSSKAPFDDVRIRKALAMAVDREDYNEVINKGLFTIASGPFGPGSVGYLEDAGFPSQDIEESKRLIAEYEADKGPLPTITYQATPGTVNQQVAVYLQQAYQAVGVNLELATVQQDKLIDNAISGEYDIMGFRNYPGGDPDSLYVWWKSDSPVNFGRINDPEIDRLLDEGRSEPDPSPSASRSTRTSTASSAPRSGASGPPGPPGGSPRSPRSTATRSTPCPSCPTGAIRSPAWPTARPPWASGSPSSGAPTLLIPGGPR